MAHRLSRDRYYIRGGREQSGACRLRRGQPPSLYLGLTGRLGVMLHSRLFLFLFFSICLVCLLLLPLTASASHHKIRARV